MEETVDLEEMQNVKETRICNFGGNSLADNVCIDNPKCISRRDEILNTRLEDWIENHDVMRLLGICQRKLQTLRSNGTIPYSRIGNSIYYRRQDIQKILADNYTMFEIHKDRA